MLFSLYLLPLYQLHALQGQYNPLLFPGTPRLCLPLVLCSGQAAFPRHQRDGMDWAQHQRWKASVPEHSS